MPLALKPTHAAVKNYYAAAMKSWKISTASVVTVVTSNLDFNNLFSGIWVSANSSPRDSSRKQQVLCSEYFDI
jgi:hypothetical protein